MGSLSIHERYQDLCGKNLRRWIIFLLLNSDKELEIVEPENPSKYIRII